MTIEEQTNTCPCGTRLSDTGPSLDYCSQTCQYRHMAVGYDPLPLPALLEWRMGWDGCRCGATGYTTVVCQCSTTPPDPLPSQITKRGMLARLRDTMRSNDTHMTHQREGN